jgi:hypothetical protein
VNREEAMAILKELVASNLVEPSFIHVSLFKPKCYWIQIRSTSNKEQIEAYTKKLGLTISEDKEGRYLFIFKP